MEKDFDIGEAIKVGWGMMKDNLGFFIVLCIINMVASIIANAISGIGQLTESGLIVFVTFILSTLVSTYIYFGFNYKVPLAFCNKEKADFSDLIIPMNQFFGMVLCYILLILIVSAGLILLIVPGIIFSLMFRMCFFVMLDQNLGPIDALKKSAELTKGVRFKLFLLSILEIFVVLAGFLCLIVGLFAAIPTIIMAEVYVYRKLVQDTDGGSEASSVDATPISPVS